MREISCAASNAPLSASPVALSAVSCPPQRYHNLSSTRVSTVFSKIGMVNTSRTLNLPENLATLPPLHQTHNCAPVGQFLQQIRTRRHLISVGSCVFISQAVLTPVTSPLKSLPAQTAVSVQHSIAWIAMMAFYSPKHQTWATSDLLNERRAYFKPRKQEHLIPQAQKGACCRFTRGPSLHIFRNR